MEIYVKGGLEDKIAKQFNIKQNLVAKLFMETMQTILDKVEK